MPSRAAEAPAAREPVRNRCRCGHFPTTHMHVASERADGSGGFRLVPDGPCALCGEAGCRQFTASL